MYSIKILLQVLGFLNILGCYITLSSSFLEYNFNLLMKRAFLLNAAFAMTIVDLTSLVHLASCVIMLPKYLNYSTFSVAFNKS